MPAPNGGPLWDQELRALRLENLSDPLAALLGDASSEVLGDATGGAIPFCGPKMVKSREKHELWGFWGVSHGLFSDTISSYIINLYHRYAEESEYMIRGDSHIISAKQKHSPTWYW